MKKQPPLPTWDVRAQVIADRLGVPVYVIRSATETTWMSKRAYDAQTENWVAQGYRVIKTYEPKRRVKC